MEAVKSSYDLNVSIFYKMGVEAVLEKNIRISVAMVTYNGGAYLRQQIDSILEQLGEQDELVVSDDGSKDDTVSILREYQKKNAKVRLFQGPGQGVKRNVEHAIQNTRGRYIFLADQDDIWLPGKVERVLQLFEKQRAAVVIHDARVFADEDTSDILMESFFAFRDAKPGVLKNIIKNSYIGCCMAFRRELLEVILPIPEQIEMHDQWIGILGDYYAGKSCFLPESLLLYRRHGKNQSAMTHYSFGKMLRNRLAFLVCFSQRVLYHHHKRSDIFVKMKKIMVDK